MERKHRHILNVARALLFQSKMPLKFWGEAVTTATHLINLTPTKILKGKSPYEVLFGKKPLYNSLRIFGSLCYVHRRDQNKDKFGERSRRCVFVGYPFGKKAWRVYDLDSNEFLVSRDISFDEKIFPYAEKGEINVEERALVSGPDDDWIINVVEKDKGKVSCIEEKSAGTEAAKSVKDAVLDASTMTPEHSVVATKQSSSDGVVDKETDKGSTETKEPELGRGCREKIPSVKLRDYINYNASVLAEEKPHHGLASSVTKSVSVDSPRYTLSSYQFYF